MNELENLREKIDAIDKEMIALFEKRMDVVADIAAYKIKNNLLPISSKISWKSAKNSSKSLSQSNNKI